MRRAAGLVVLALAAGGWTWSGLTSPDENVDQGNDAFHAGKYDEAASHYRDALAVGEDPRIHLDLGAALYKQAEAAKDAKQKADLFKQAEGEFARAAEARDPKIKSRAYYNQGNADYQRHAWDEAVTAYRRSLRANPDNDRARYNLEMALRQRKKQQKKQPQSGQGQGQQGQGQQQKQQQGQGQGQGQQKQQQQGQGQGQQQQKQQQGQGQGQGQQRQDPQKRPQGQGQQQKQQQGQGDPQKQQQGQGGQEGQQQEQPRPQGGQGQSQGQQDHANQRGLGPRDTRPRHGLSPDDGDDDESSSEEDQKLKALEDRSKELRRRLLRQMQQSRDPLHLPSRKDW